MLKQAPPSTEQSVAACVVKVGHNSNYSKAYPMHATAPATKQGATLFALFCLASFLLSLSYGSTFLLSLLIHSRGGNEHDAGSVISAAMLSTFAAVIVSGHLSDLLGAARSIALFGLLLVAASLGDRKSTRLNSSHLGISY